MEIPEKRFGVSLFGVRALFQRRKFQRGGSRETKEGAQKMIFREFPRKKIKIFKISIFEILRFSIFQIFFVNIVTDSDSHSH